MDNTNVPKRFKLVRGVSYQVLEEGLNDDQNQSYDIKGNIFLVPIPGKSPTGYELVALLEHKKNLK